VVHSLERTAVQCPEPGTGKSAECNAVHYGSSSCLDLPAGTPCAGGTCDRGGYCVPN
jgi:hypothetical protein